MGAHQRCAPASSKTGSPNVMPYLQYHRTQAKMISSGNPRRSDILHRNVCRDLVICSARLFKPCQSRPRGHLCRKKYGIIAVWRNHHNSFDSRRIRPQLRPKRMRAVPAAVTASECISPKLRDALMVWIPAAKRPHQFNVSTALKLQAS